MNEMATPYACLHLTEVDSTQDEARSRYAGDPMLVVAERQTHGRGRLGRIWEQAPRGLAASLAFEPDWPATTWPRLTLVAGLAALEILPEPLDMRWPNDLFRSDRKAGGILVEASGGLVVAGIGANLWWPDPPEDRVGLYHKDPGPEAAVELASTWADVLLRRVGGSAGDWGRAEAESRCATIGQVVIDGQGNEVTAVGIDDDGSLIVDDRGVRSTIRSGPVSVVGDA